MRRVNLLLCKRSASARGPVTSRSAAIVQARDVGNLTTPDGQWLPYMVLEWLEGKALDVVLGEEARAGFPPRSRHEARGAITVS
jgi:hypothetical protein